MKIRSFTMLVDANETNEVERKEKERRKAKKVNGGGKIKETKNEVNRENAEKGVGRAESNADE